MSERSPKRCVPRLSIGIPIELLESDRALDVLSMVYRTACSCFPSTRGMEKHVATMRQICIAGRATPKSDPATPKSDEVTRRVDSIRGSLPQTGDFQASRKNIAGVYFKPGDCMMIAGELVDATGIFVLGPQSGNTQIAMCLTPKFLAVHF